MNKPKPQFGVDQVTQSPMNASRWLLSLVCGHETWVTAKRKPRQKFAECATCCPTVKMP